MVAIPDDDVADAHGDVDSAGTFDLRAADLDRIAVTDVFLDCRGQPWRHHVDIDRAGAKPPPHPGEAPAEDHHQDRNDDGEALYPALTDQPAAERSDAIAKPVKTGVRAR